MNKIEEMIERLCPDGVEHKALSELFDTRNGYTPSKSNAEFWDKETIPWFRMEDIRENGRILNDSIQHITPKAVKNGKLFPAGSIILATSATIGEHALLGVDGLTNQRFTCLTLKSKYRDLFNTKFLFYYAYRLGDYCRQNLNNGNFASVNMDALKQFKIPVPPREIQDEIVRILDSFAELEARKAQYAHYRDKLLDFSTRGGVTLMPLGDICSVERGKRVVRTQLEKSGKYPVYQNSLTPLGYFDNTNCIKGTTFVIGAGGAGQIGFSTNNFWAADDCYPIVCSETIRDRFLYYFLLTQQNYIDANVRRSSIPRLSRRVLEKIVVPVPTLKEQERIVSILDKFDALVNDISEGLPAEIEARRKQYEYYRDKLLSFKEEAV